MDNLVRLESEVRKAFAMGEYMLSVFFDLEKAYDITWRYGIIQDMHETGLRGYLSMYVQELLRERRFQVRIKNHLSEIKRQANGVSQGNVLAVTLFALNINSVAKLIRNKPGFVACLYVDDLQIGYRHSDISEAKAELQQCLFNAGR